MKWRDIRGFLKNVFQFLVETIVVPAVAYSLGMHAHSRLSHSSTVPRSTVEIFREVFAELEAVVEENGHCLSIRVSMENAEMQAICWGEPGDIAQVLIRLPIKARANHRARVGELLHRLNLTAQRKLWEMDYDGGEIRLCTHLDTPLGPLTAEYFRRLFSTMLLTADIVFPYLAGVILGRYLPEVAADQAEAALRLEWQKTGQSTEEN